MARTSPGTPSVLRAMNDRAALDLLVAHGPLSRSRIGRLTGLSKPTASQLLARLEAAGLVVVTGTSSGRPGPDAQLYAVNPDAAHVAGLDVTSRGIHAAVADVTGRTIGRYDLPTPGRRPGRSVRELVVRAVEGAAESAGLHPGRLHRTVIGTPGAFDPTTGRLRYASHLPGWHSPTLLDELAAALPMPLAYDNDVNLVAIAEQHLGSAGDTDDFVLLWIEEGIGAALVIDGRLHRGRTGGAGEVGFLPVPGTRLVRNAARAGSGGFQELAGAGAVLRTARELGLVYERHTSPQAAAAAVLRRAAARVEAGVEAGEAAPPGDGPAAAGLGDAAPHAELLDRLATGTAVGLASLVAVLDPQLVVLSGGVLAAGGEVLRERIRDRLTQLVVPRPRLVPGTVVERPVLSGALVSALLTTRDEVFDTSR